MKNLVLIIFLLPFLSYGQGDQTIINVPINAGGTTFQAILHLPDDYATTSTVYPLMMFFHGLGEGGANPASIYTSSTAGGPAYFIAQGTFPSSFVNPKDGKTYKYIVVSPQANPEGVQGSTTALEADYILTYLYAHYRVDTTRVYFTGLSDGGETCDEYLGGIMSNGGNFLSFTKTHHVAAIIPMSENGVANFIPAQADTIVTDSIGAWGFGSTDEQGQNTLQLAWYCNQIKPGWMITTSYVGGHCCWGQFYNPTFTQNGMSIYQWALQYTSPGATTLTTVPEANGGAPQTIQLPTSQTTLNGDSSTVTNGKILKYLWSQKSGPSKAVITDSAAAVTPVTGLTDPGVHVFALQITDNMGNTSTATTQVTVNATVAAKDSIPGKIEAENYDSMSGGVQKEVTLDSGGGENVGAINIGDWMDYSVNVTAAGTYTASFRVAALNRGASFQVRSASDSVLATITVPATGGFQTWTTVSTPITLPAGSQTLQIYSSAAVNWNFNWMQFAIGGSTTGQAIPGKIEAESYSAMSGVQKETTLDTGGGEDVGSIDLGDWMDYAVNVTAAGTYTASFRVAALNRGASFQVRSASDSVLATITVPSTGGFQTWTTVNAVITLPAGSQTLQIYSSAAANWNFNWMQFASGDSVTGQAIPGKIEGESYSSMSGVQKETTLDTGGGEDVGSIDLGDWMDYAVNVTAAGTYTASFRVAALNRGASFQVRSSSDSVLATIAVPSTGGFQTWTTVSTPITLPAGGQTLQIYSSAAPNWNFNWMQFATDTTETQTDQSLASEQLYILDTTASFVLFPNPVRSLFTVGVSNGYTGNMIIQVIDVSGAMVHVLASYKDQPSVTVNMTAADLAPGIYFIRVQIGKWSAVKKIVKQ